MSKNRPKPAAALYFSGALSATPVGVHQKCRSANTNPDYCRPLFSLKPLMLSLVGALSATLATNLITLLLWNN